VKNLEDAEKLFEESFPFMCSPLCMCKIPTEKLATWPATRVATFTHDSNLGIVIKFIYLELKN
jgi:hypothetical protein